MGDEAIIFLRDKGRPLFARRKKNNELAAALLARLSSQENIAVRDDLLEIGREFHGWSPSLKSQASSTSGSSFGVP
jgi:hypothetical protein